MRYKLQKRTATFGSRNVVCDSDFSHFLQRFAQLTVGPMECVWAERVAVRRAGPAQAVTSVYATRYVSNMELARTESASVTRAGTESTAPSVSSCVCVCACGGVCSMCVCVSARGCAQKHQHQVRLNWQLLSTLLKEFRIDKWREKGDLRELKRGVDVGGGCTERRANFLEVRVGGLQKSTI